MADAARSSQTAVPPLAAAGWTVQLVVNEKTLLRPASVFAFSPKAYTAHSGVHQLTPVLRFAVVWHDGRPNPAPSVGTCWIQQGGEASPTTLIGSTLLVPDQQRWASLTSTIESGAMPLKVILTIRDPDEPGAQPAETIASFVLVCNFPQLPPTTNQAPDFEKTVATLYRHLPPSAHLRYLDGRLSEDALAPDLRASVADRREHVVEHLRRESVSALQTEFFGLMNALTEENPVPDANASFEGSA